MRRVLPFALLTCLGVADLAFGAHGRPQEYQAPQMTEEELAAQRARAKNKLPSFAEAEEQPVEEHFPWMALGLGLLAFGVAAPFGWYAYKAMAKDIKDVEAASAPAAPVRRTKPPSKAQG